MIPGFISGTRGDLFTVYFPPEPSAKDRGDLIFVPPFAEELNRSRATISAQARALQRIGYGALLLDLYGTGDSAGDFADARWEIWCDDLASASDWLISQNRHVSALWGVRLGGLLAVDAAARQPGRYQRLLLWEPVLRGKDYIDRFLQIGATSQEGASSGVSVSGDRIKVSPTEAVEVAGYPVPRSLIHALVRTDLESSLGDQPVHIDWIDLREPGAERSKDVDEISQKLKGIGGSFGYSWIEVQPFWSVQGVGPDEELLDATGRALEQGL